MTDAEVAVLLEAAQWAPSAGNSQPWMFSTALRGHPEHERLVVCLAGSSRPWAAEASLLVVNVCHLHVEGTDWEYSEFGQYDLGQAVAHLTVQAHSMGLACRQFAAFDRTAVTELLQIPDHWRVMTMTAIGRAATSALPGPRVRVEDITRLR